MGHRVTAAGVQVKVGGRVHTVFRGDNVPDGVDDADLERLVAKGLIAVVEDEPEGDGKEPEAKPAGRSGKK